MTLFLIALFLASPPTDYPIAARVACVIAFLVDMATLRNAYVEIQFLLQQIRAYLMNRRD